jgi:hypothetical protein
MNKAPEKQSQNGTNAAEQSSASQNGSKVSKADASAMKAFIMTNKRLHPELYKGNSKVGKVRS